MFLYRNLLGEPKESTIKKGQETQRNNHSTSLHKQPKQFENVKKPKETIIAQAYTSNRNNLKTIKVKKPKESIIGENSQLLS